MPIDPSGPLDPQATTLIAAAAAFAVLLASAAGGYLVLRARYGAPAQLTRRALQLAGKPAVEGRPVEGEATRRRRTQVKLREMDAQQRRRGGLRRLLREAGVALSPETFMLLAALAGLASFGLAAAAGAPMIGAVALGGLMALVAPRWLIGHIGRSRRKAFTRHFAGALDVIVRGVQSGLPVEECFNVIAQESPDPVGREFRLIVEASRLGLSHDEALQRAYERMPTPELKFFATVLGIQKQTGGSLAETLSNLSRVLRERHKMASKVRALSSEARASAIIIGTLPVLVAGLLLLVNESYLALMVKDPIGHLLIGFAVLIMALGTFIMRRMVSFEI